jgi:hypothetical protein
MIGGSQSAARILSASSFSQNFLQNQNANVVNTEIPSRGVRMHFQGFKRNVPDFYHYMKEKRHHNRNAYKIPQTRSKRFPGHIDIYDHQGNREALGAAVQRFKRLDFGTYVRVVPGRYNKLYKKSESKQWQQEQHMFAWKEFM